MSLTYLRLKNKYTILQIIIVLLILLSFMGGCSKNKSIKENSTSNEEYSATEAYLSEEKNKTNDINYLKEFSNLIDNGVSTLNKIVNYMENEGVDKFDRRVVVEMLDSFDKDRSKFIKAGYDGWDETIKSLREELKDSPYITYLYVTASQSNQKVYDNQEIYNHAIDAKNDLESLKVKLTDL